MPHARKIELDAAISALAALTILRGRRLALGGRSGHDLPMTRLELRGPTSHAFDQILTPDALEFVGALQHEFGARRKELLQARAARRARLADGGSLGFLAETEDVRESDWTVAPAGDDLQQRWVEITGPTDRKMTINALNSGADGFMADFEDANAPTWTNMVEGQINVRDAIDGTITYEGSDGRHYELVDGPATLLVRPRGWHLPERHLVVDGQPTSGSLFDFGLFFFHCAPRLLSKGTAPYFYLPKMESHLEARLWSDVFAYAEQGLGIEHGTTKATVLIETLPAAFEMHEILYELREHSAGLNAGRWDYIFSSIKCFRERPEMVLPDRGDVTMTVPFMRAYTDLLVATCHRRCAHAMGGMAALIPSRKDDEANQKALSAVRVDKEREVGQGYDGTWVAHPDLVPVAREVFERGLSGAPNQLHRRRGDVHVGADELLDLPATPGHITEAGLRTDVNVGFQYVSFWLGGRGAAAINSLMEDAATAEISRSQIWQWVHHKAKLEDGRTVTPDLVREILDQETAKIRDAVGEETWAKGRPDETREVFERVCLSEELTEFLTLPAYQYLQ
jgi:malate synthase